MDCHFWDLPDFQSSEARLTLKVPDKLQLYGLYVYYVVHICDIGMLRVNDSFGCPYIERVLCSVIRVCCLTRIYNPGACTLALRLSLPAGP